jgi:hypothetical protein
VSSRSLAWRIGDAGATAARPRQDSNFTYNRGDGDSIEDRLGLQLKTRIFLLPLVLVQTLAVLPSASDARGQARSVVPWDIGALALAASVECSDCLAGSTGASLGALFYWSGQTSHCGHQGSLSPSSSRRPPPPWARAPERWVQREYTEEEAHCVAVVLTN